MATLVPSTRRVTLYRSIRDEDWETARRILWQAAATSAADCYDCDGRLEFQREVRREFLQPRDVMGANLVHYACANPKVPVDLVAAIFRASTAAGLERWCSHAVDRGGSSAVHYAAALGSDEVLALVLQCLPRSLVMGTKKTSFSPCQLVWHSYFHQRPSEPKEALKERIYHLTNAHSSSLRSRLPDAVRQLWSKTMILCSHERHRTIAFHGSHTSNAQCLFGKDVIAALIRSKENGLDGPTVAVWFALQGTTTDLLTPCDDEGNLLLHIAAASAPLSVLRLGQPQQQPRSAETEASSSWLAWAQRSVLAQLCFLEPRAARVRNRAGQLPLHVAALPPHPWTDGLDVLLRAHPGARTVLDPVSQLPPFLQQAALAGDGCHHLTTLFEMIRNNADLIDITPNIYS